MASRSPDFQAGRRAFESRPPLQNTYTLRKAGRNAQPLSFQTGDNCFLAEGLRSSAGIRRSWFAIRRSPRYGSNIVALQDS
jgi:hypothetical protein